MVWNGPGKLEPIVSPPPNNEAPLLFDGGIQSSAIVWGPMSPAPITAIFLILSMSMPANSLNLERLGLCLEQLAMPQPLLQRRLL